MRIPFLLSLSLLSAFAATNAAEPTPTPPKNSIGLLFPSIVAIGQQPEEKLPRGLKPTPASTLVKNATERPFKFRGAKLPASVLYVPKQLSVWGNNQYGDCVTAEEAFNQGACNVFVPDATVIAWARKYGYLNGAYLEEVMDTMQKNGFPVGGKTHGIGTYYSVNFANEQTLQEALTVAPVKLGMDADALPNGAGSKQGWYATGGRPGQYTSENHCTSLAGYGPVKTVFSSIGKEVPANWPASSTTAYLYFTWGTLGVVDHNWLMSCTMEAFVRNPTQSINGVPQPNPGPNPSPEPPPVPVPPTPTPVPPAPSIGDIKIDLTSRNITAPAGWTLNGGSIPSPGPGPAATSDRVEWVKNRAAHKQARKDGAGLIVSPAELAAARSKINAAVSDADTDAMIRDMLKKSSASDKLGGPFTDFIEWVVAHQAEIEALIALIMKIVALFGI